MYNVSLVVAGDLSFRFCFKMLSVGVDMSRSMSGLLKSVLTLRAANWGRVTSPSPSPVTPPSLNTFTQEPVFYNTTGQRITREDAGYGECGLVFSMEFTVEFASRNHVSKILMISVLF